MKRPFIYIALPYTHPDKAVRDERMKGFANVAAEIENAGRYHVLSGVLATAIVERSSIPLPDDYAFWGSYSESLLRVCEGVVLIPFIGWEKSIGVTAELALAKTLNIPIYVHGDEHYRKWVLQ